LEYFNETDGHVTCNECKERIKEGEMFAQCVGDFEACPGESSLPLNTVNGLNSLCPKITIAVPTVSTIFKTKRRVTRAGTTS